MRRLSIPVRQFVPSMQQRQAAVCFLVGLGLCFGAMAQPEAQSTLVGNVNEDRLDMRPDSGGELVGLVQGGDGVQRGDLRKLAGLLPEKDDLEAVCLKARSRAGNYVADGKLAAPKLRKTHELRVQAPGFPKFTDQQDVLQPRPEDLAVLFVAPPCGARSRKVYPASLGLPGNSVTALLNLGSLRGTPTSALVLGESSRKVDGACRVLEGRSRSYNVLCRFTVPSETSSKGEWSKLQVDFSPERGPDNSAEFSVWVAPPRP